MAGDEEMNVEAVREKLRKALALQYRSALQYTLTSGSLFGLEYQGLGDRLWTYAQAELEDARLLVEKITSLEGEPSTDVAEMTARAHHHAQAEPGGLPAARAARALTAARPNGRGRRS